MFQPLIQGSNSRQSHPAQCLFFGRKREWLCK